LLHGLQRSGAGHRAHADASEVVRTGDLLLVLLTDQQLLNGTVDSVTTDGAILLGFAAQDPENLEVVGPVFSEERYGVGYFPPDDTATCQFITDAIQSMYDDGYWKKAFESTLGEAGVETPAPPEPDPCS